MTLPLVKTRPSSKNPIFVFQDNPEQSLVIPVCLPWTSNQPDFVLDVGKKFTVAGWGRTSNDAILSNNNFQKFSASTRYVRPSPDRTGLFCSTNLPLAHTFTSLCPLFQ